MTRPPPTPLWRLALKRNRWSGQIPLLDIRDSEPDLLDKLDEYGTLCQVDTAALPLCWPQVAAAPLHSALIAHPDFPLAAMGLVHVTQQITRHRPLPRDGQYALRAHFDGFRTAKRGIEVVMRTALSDGEGIAWEGETVFLSRGAPGDGVDRPVDETLPAAGIERTWALPADLGRRYGVIAGDKNPIHLYAWTAKLFGFQRAIIHGMWLVGRAMGELDDDWDRVTVRFRRPVLLPGTVTFLADDQRFAVLAGDRPCVLGERS